MKKQKKRIWTDMEVKKLLLMAAAEIKKESPTAKKKSLTGTASGKKRNSEKRFDPKKILLKVYHQKR
jgi:hypothetical protein